MRCGCQWLDAGEHTIWHTWSLTGSLGIFVHSTRSSLIVFFCFTVLQTGRAIKFAVDHVFSSSQRASQVKNRIAVVVTDGKSQDDVVNVTLPCSSVWVTPSQVYVGGPKSQWQCQGPSLWHLITFIVFLWHCCSCNRLPKWNPREAHFRPMFLQVDASMEARAQGITVFAVGVGSEITTSELVSIANKPSSTYVLYAEDYTTIDRIRDSMEQKLCEGRDI